MARNYKNLEIFKIGYQIALDIYKLTDKLPRQEIPVLVNQLRRAAISIPSNIVEGSTRRSPKEFLMFLSYSYGSAKEVTIQLNIAKDVGYVQETEFYAQFNHLIANLDKFQAMIYKFMRNLEEKTPYSFYQEFKKEVDRKS